MACVLRIASISATLIAVEPLSLSFSVHLVFSSDFCFARFFVQQQPKRVWPLACNNEGNEIYRVDPSRLRVMSSNSVPKSRDCQSKRQRNQTGTSVFVTNVRLSLFCSVIFWNSRSAAARSHLQLRYTACRVVPVSQSVKVRKPNDVL